MKQFHLVSAARRYAPTRILPAFTVLCCVGVGLITRAGAATPDSVVPQRGDRCVILNVDRSRVEGDSLVWKFDLRQPGNYVVQLVVETAKGKGAPAGRVEIDGTALSQTLKKVYVSEDGIVSGFDEPAVLQRAGTHTLKLQTPMALAKVRLIPQGYVNSRISISSCR
jgi:hypothetical protein